jgi:hypothetical protein
MIANTICITGIVAGVMVMLMSIARAVDILRVLPFVKTTYRQRLTRLIMSSILFFGAVFVYVGTFVQSQMIQQMQTTIGELLPICAKCRKIRNPDAKSDDKTSWEQIENYIQHNTHIDFTHSYCPECAASMIDEVRKETV